MPDTDQHVRPRRRRPRDAQGAVAFAKWALKDAGTKCGRGDDHDLAALVALRTDLEREITAAVQGLKYGEGFSWATIGEALGMTRQSAQERWGR